MSASNGSAYVGIVDRIIAAADRPTGIRFVGPSVTANGQESFVSWRHIHDDARVVGAALQARGLVPGDQRAWVRYDAQSREGPGRFSEAKSILRLSADWTIRPSEPCSRANAGEEVRLPYSGTDLFMK